MAPSCYFCAQTEIVPILDLGLQPVSNRFLRNFSKNEYRVPLILSQCNGCGLVQMNPMAPIQELQSQYEWLKYNEPEGHLDHLVNLLSHLPRIGRNDRVCGFSSIDETTLTRLNQVIGTDSWRLDLDLELGIQKHLAGMETFQSQFTCIQASLIH